MPSLAVIPAYLARVRPSWKARLAELFHRHIPSVESVQFLNTGSEERRKQYAWREPRQAEAT